MAGIVSEESVGRSIEGISSGLRIQSGETLTEWRSSEQLENGTPSTSPPFWDSDEDDDSGPKPSELYGKYTWKIEKFSQLNKRELRSNAFEVGGYKWYILIYPQGCDVCNHLSLFLCVANHDRLLPGWSHFAQFTIAVVNKDPKKSKYSGSLVVMVSFCGFMIRLNQPNRAYDACTDTLHRFWKKEHDWGWKKFMELSKVLDGFVDADTLIIKAQVQVIRERAEQPFRCLDCQYRRELVRVYLTNVEQICRRFVEERRSKLGKLIEDKQRWLSFCTFWLGIDQSARRRMSREKTNAILKVVVKHFFIEKEVTSTLVMDSLYSGLRTLEGQTKNKKVGTKLLEAEEMPAPIVRIEKDMFVLVDDVLLLLERAALEPLPPKDEKGPQNRIKEGSSGEDFNKDSIERDERRLTELGRRTVEIFVLAHIYSNKVEVAYQEAVALKRQEELIREEEAAWQAESEQKARRGATEKEKKAKKKQAKQKRNNRKGREKGREERIILDRHEKEIVSDVKVVTNVEEMHPVFEKPDMLEDVSDVSDSGDAVAEARHPDSEDRETSPVNWDTDTSEIQPPTDSSRSVISSLSSAQTVSSDRKNASMMDDSSSTCSTDSVLSLVMNGSYKGSSFPNYKNQKAPSRRKNLQGKASDKTTLGNETDSQPSGPSPDTGDQSDVSEASKPGESELEAAVVSLSHQDQSRGVEPEMAKKERGMVAAQRKQSPKNQVDAERTLKDKTTVVTSSVQNTQTYLPTSSEQKSDHRNSAYSQKTSLNGSHSRAAPAVISPPLLGALKSEVQKALTPKIPEKAMVQQVSMMSSSSSAALIPALRHPAPVVSLAQTTQPFLRSASAAGRLGPDPLPATHSYAPPQSYRNAIMGNIVSPNTTGFTQPSSPPPGVNPSPLFSHTTALVSSPMFLSQNCESLDSNPVKPSFPLGMVSRDALPNVLPRTNNSQMDGRIVHFNSTSLLNDDQNLEFHPPLYGGNHEQLLADFSACTSGRHGQGLAEEFPHLGIINDLLDEEQCVVKAGRSSSIFPSFSNGSTLLNRQFSLPGDVGISGDVGSSTNSCRFDRTHSYHGGGFRRGYSSSSIGHFEPVIDYMLPVSTLSYVNGQIDGIISSQWQIDSDPSFFQYMNPEYEPYPYLGPDYSNMACRTNGYNVFQPSNGN